MCFIPVFYLIFSFPLRHFARIMSIVLVVQPPASTYDGSLPSFPMDNRKHFWLYNRRNRSDVAAWKPKKPQRIPERVRQREQIVLNLLMTANRPVHIDRIAEELHLSRAATRAFLVTHGQRLWTGEGGWWRTMLRER